MDLDLTEELPEGNRDEIGIKLAKELENIDDERVLWDARIKVKEKMIEDCSQIIYYLASKISMSKNYKIASIEGIFNSSDSNSSPLEITKPKQKTISHVNIWFEI